MFGSDLVTEDEATWKLPKQKLTEMVEAGTFLIKSGSPRIVEVTTDMDDDGVVYDGKIVIEDSDRLLKKSGVEMVLHQLKHCFKGDYLREDGSKRVPDWMVNDFRTKTGKHNRVSIAYTVTMRNSDGSLIVNFHRSMGRGASGAHRLCKVTPQNAQSQVRKITWYNDQCYYVIPLVAKEANYLMQLFATMAVEALESEIFEQEMNREPSTKQREEASIGSSMSFGALAPIMG